MIDLWYRIFSLEEGQELDTSKVRHEYLKTVRRVDNLKHTINFGSVFDIEKCSPLDRLGVISYDKAFNRYKNEQIKQQNRSNNP